MTFDLPGGRRLILAGSGLGGFWAAAGLAAAVLLVLLYREERRLVPRRAGLALLALRLLAASALVAALFEPIAARTYRESVRGRVVVAVDVSESMATTDPGRPGGLTRREVARRLIDGPLARLARDHGVEAVAFARSAAVASLPALSAALARPARRGDPEAQVTDWEPALAQALKGAPGDAPVAGVVLVTDGRRNAAGDTSPTVERLAARGVPVFGVLVGSTVPPRDAAVASVKAPESVYLGDVATVEATLKLDGYAGAEVAVTLERPGGSPVRKVVRAPADGSRPTVTFRVPLEEPGAAGLAVAVAPMPGDSRPDNDRRVVTVSVLDDKARVLLVDGEARWEFRYLRNALARDPRVAVEAVVARPPPGGPPTYPAALPPREGPGGDPLGAFDVVAVGDLDPAELSPDAWARLDAYVSERGGTLVLAPGPRSWAARAGSEPARALLPVLDPKPVRVDPKSDDPAHPELPPGVPFVPVASASADLGAWPMLQLAEDADESRRRWAGLPRLPWAVAGRAKPGASALATAGGDPSAVVLAAQAYGLGKVLWVGTDATWRWRHRVGDAYHHRFWGQVVRWSATGKLAAGNAFVRFGPLRPRSGEGEPVRVSARVAEGVPGVGADPLIAARVFRAGQAAGDAAAVVALRPVPGRPRTFEGDAPSLPVGSYVVRLDAPGLAGALRLGTPAPEAPLEVVARDTSERVELAASRDALDRLAAATGGAVLPDREADRLPGRLRARTTEVVRSVETPLWDTPAALLAFVAILTAEWVARKRLGLA